jgi:hypothetical protein
MSPHRKSQMRIIAFITNYAVVDRIIKHLKLTFVAERSPTPHMVYQKPLMAAEPPTDFSKRPGLGSIAAEYDEKHRH